jgi:phosphoribosylamine--glycine ligase
VWKLSQSPEIKKLYAAPGNGGISEQAECVDLEATDVQALADFAESKSIDLTIVGPEVALAVGIVDAFQGRGLRIFGPTQAAAQLEASKVFSKTLMKKYGIPTADFAVFSDPALAKEYVQSKGAPLVVKADGLCAGKGTIIAHTIGEALGAIDLMMVDKIFGAAGERVLIEELLEGDELSMIVVTDGKTVVPMVTAQDHKRLQDGDLGPNTGGMGAYAPAPMAAEPLIHQMLEQVVYPTIKAMANEDRPFKGVLYTGFMLTPQGPKVLEYNVRFGDPEAQVILPLLESDLLALLDDAVAGRLDTTWVEWKSAHCATVVLAAGGYPGEYARGKRIDGLAAVVDRPDAWVLHAGTRQSPEGLVTAGGRVLNIMGMGPTLEDALKAAYGLIGTVRFEGMQYRRDIGHRALRQASA